MLLAITLCVGHMQVCGALQFDRSTVSVVLIDCIHKYVLKEVGLLLWKCCLEYSFGVRSPFVCIL